METENHAPTIQRKESGPIVNINGRLLHRDAAGVSPLIRRCRVAMPSGKGCRLYQGRIFKLNEHLARCAGPRPRSTLPRFRLTKS